MEKKPYYISTAIAYTSGKPHIGNTYEIVLADSIARFKRMQGYDVYFQTGTDEHGQKIEEKAKAAGLTPQEFVDGIAGDIRAIWDLMNTSYDKFVRTTDQNHKVQVQKIFKKLYDQGDIYLGNYQGLYCTACESFFSESQLEEGHCPDCSGAVHEQKEEAYFFKLSKYANRLIEHIKSHPEFIQPESRKNEMMNNFLIPGLQDLCVSRTSFKWGIPVSFDEKHVVYVWIDALSNYISGLGYDLDGEHGEYYNKYWPADLHLLGKDIIRFHTIYWPIMLMALDIPLPNQVFGHPWLLTGDKKMSKSKGNTIYADDLVKLFGVDAVRYYVLNEMPFDNDGTITHELLVERINSDLANILGNLVNRTIAMSNKYFDGIVENPQCVEEIDQELIGLALRTPKEVAEKMEKLRVADAISKILTLLRRSNKYIDETMPWVLAKDPLKQKRLKTVLYNLVESIRIAGVCLEAFLPETSKKILDSINTDQRNFLDLTNFGLYKAGTSVVSNPEMLFARLDLKEVLNKLEEKKPTEKVLEKNKTSEITIDDFSKIEMKVGTVIKSEIHPKADRLLVSQVNLGAEVRQIVSGLIPYYTAETIVGKKVIVVTNLKEANLRGVKSQGMLLAGSTKKEVALVTLAKDLPDGTKIS